MEKNPFEKVLDQIAEVMQFAYDNVHKPVPIEKQAEVEAKLDALEKQVAELQKMGDEFVEETGMSDFVFQEMLTDETSEQITQEDRKLLVKSEEIKAEAALASKDAMKAAETARASGKRLVEKKKPGKTKSAQARKGKFKSQGGYKNWTPM